MHFNPLTSTEKCDVDTNETVRQRSIVDKLHVDRDDIGADVKLLTIFVLAAVFRAGVLNLLSLRIQASGTSHGSRPFDRLCDNSDTISSGWCDVMD